MPIMLLRCPECHSRDLVPIVYFRAQDRYPARYPETKESLERLVDERFQQMLRSTSDHGYKRALLGDPAEIQRKKKEILQDLQREKGSSERFAKWVEETRQELSRKEDAGILVARPDPWEDLERSRLYESRQKAEEAKKAGKRIELGFALEHHQRPRRPELHCKDCGRDWMMMETSPKVPRESEPLLEHHLHRSLKQYSDELASGTTWGEARAGKTYPEMLGASCYVGSLAMALVSKTAGGIVQDELVNYPVAPGRLGWVVGSAFYESAREIVEASEETRGKFLRLVDGEALLDNKWNASVWKPRKTIKDDRNFLQQQEILDQERVEISVLAMKYCIEAIRIIARLLGYTDFGTVGLASLEYAFPLLVTTFKNNALAAARLIIGTRALGDYANGISITVQDYSREFDGLARELEETLRTAHERAVEREGSGHRRYPPNL